MSRPGFMGFMKPVAAERPPTGEGWIHEIKHDGYRTQLCIGDGEARAYSKSGHDWTAKYRLIADAALGLRCRSAALDGEVIVFGEHGRSDFAALPAAIRHAPENLVFGAFDLLHLDGKDLRLKPLLERKELLRRLVGTEGGPLQFSDHWEGDGKAFFDACDRMGLEGAVSKRAQGTYRAGPARQWLKAKCYRVDDFDVIGVGMTGRGENVAFLAFPDTDLYAGSAFVTLRRGEKERFWRAVERLKTDTPLKPRKSNSVRLAPGLKAKVRHLRGEERLRHASLLGIDDSAALTAGVCPRPPAEATIPSTGGKPMAERCKTCLGTGGSRCSRCGGSGQSRCGACGGAGGNCHSCRGGGTSTCYACNGAGKEACYSCNGSGRS